jgi:hypothetical protein
MERTLRCLPALADRRLDECYQERRYEVPIDGAADPAAYISARRTRPADKGRARWLRERALRAAYQGRPRTAEGGPDVGQLINTNSLDEKWPSKGQSHTWPRLLHRYRYSATSSVGNWGNIPPPVRRNRACFDANQAPDVGALASEHPLGLAVSPKIGLQSATGRPPGEGYVSTAGVSWSTRPSPTSSSCRRPCRRERGCSETFATDIENVLHQT